MGTTPREGNCWCSVSGRCCDGYAGVLLGVRAGSLFSGIGLLDYGLSLAGIEHAWFCESDPWRREILSMRWPGVPIYRDVRDVDLAARRVDLIAGGFPCPAVSHAARGRNTGEWMWPEFARVVSDLRPRTVLVENAEGLRYSGRGLGEVLEDLAAMGFDAEWGVLRASAFGAPHRRARVWVVAYPNQDRQPNVRLDDETPILQEPRGPVRIWPDPPGDLRVDDRGTRGVVRSRLSALGDGVQVQCGEFIGRRLMDIFADGQEGEDDDE